MLLKFKLKLTSIFLLLTVGSCSQPVVNTLDSEKINSGSAQESSLYSKSNNHLVLSGKVEFPGQFNVKATVGEVGSSATVSLIYPAEHPAMANKTVATGLTSSSGEFTINPDSSFEPASGDIFRLEALKRMAGAGTSVATLNTYVKWNGAGWSSITTPDIKLNKETTALAIIEMNDNSLNPADIIGKINSLNSTYTQAGSITPQIYSEVTGLVEEVLTKNLDPVQYIKWTGVKAVITNPAKVSTFKNDFITYSEVVEGSGGSFPSFCEFDPYHPECYGSPGYCSYEPWDPVCQGQSNYPPYCNHEWYRPECQGSPGYCSRQPSDPMCQGSSGSAAVYAIDPADMNRMELINMGPQLGITAPSLLSVTGNGKSLIFKYTQNGQEILGNLSTSIINQQEPYVISSNINSVTDFVPSPAKNLFAFISENKLYVINGNIGNLKLASSGIGQNGITGIKWSPDSRRLLFSAHDGSRYNLFVFNSETGITTPLTGSLTGPASITVGYWSPDSSKIVFEASVGTRNDLYAVNAGGGSTLLISGGTALTNDKPEWSPDSAKVLWRKQNSANDYDWYVSNTQTPVVQTNLTGIYSLTSTTTYDNTKRWSPDSLKVCFDANNGIRSDTYVADLSQDNTFIITPPDVQSESMGLEPKFSKDSSKVILRAKDASDRSDLYFVALSGNNTGSITSGLGPSNHLLGGSNEDPSGNKLMIFSGSSVYSANNDGSGLTSLSNLDGFEGLYWYPNGKRIVFTKNNDIHIVNPDNTGYGNITNDPTNPKSDIKLHVRN